MKCFMNKYYLFTVWIFFHKTFHDWYYLLIYFMSDTIYSLCEYYYVKCFLNDIIPPAAPATRRVFRSAADRWKNCAKSEAKAPPVIIIGTSAPKGPPVPMEIAEDKGLRIATFRSIRLRPNNIASRASGIPWPLIFSDP